MKKILSLILAFSLCLSFVGCGGDEDRIVVFFLNRCD